MKTWTRSILPALLLTLSGLATAQVSLNISVNAAPPELPVYDQPPIPEDGYLWTPGYWAWSDDGQDYYWVPGTWVLPPEPDYLWTPGYWGAEGGAFLWHAGYWGPQVGFYGGVNYGYGYGGSGFEGGYWRGGHLYYNRAVSNVGAAHIGNVYNRTVINHDANRVSYNGGRGGIGARPSTAELAAAHDRHIAVTQAQHQHETAARSNPALRNRANDGHPPIAATARPGSFSAAGVVGAKQHGTLSVVHQNPQPHNPQPRPAPAAHEPAPRAPQAPRQEPREPATPQQRALPPRSPQNSIAPRSGVEPRREPEHTQPTRQSAPRPEPRAEAHPAQHAPEQQGNHEHH